MNPAAEGLTGWKQAEAMGLDVIEVFRVVDKAGGEPVENPAARALREGAPVGPEDHTLLIGKNGSETRIEYSGAPIRDADGTIIGAAVIFRDITERKRAEEARRERDEKFRSLITNITGYKRAEEALKESEGPLSAIIFSEKRRREN